MENKEKYSTNIAHFAAVKGMQKCRKKQPKQMFSLNLFKDTFAKPNKQHSVELYQYNEYGKALEDIYSNVL